MMPRITFLLIAAFWVTMNVLLWRAEYDSHGTGVSVPVALVGRKILTAPDISSLNFFQDGRRIGFGEFFTSVEQEMAKFSETAPPSGFVSRAGYQVHFNGNASLGDITNRLTFSGQLEFTRQRQWQELNLTLSTRLATVEIHSRAAEQNVHLKITSNGASTEQVFSFDDLQNPDRWWRVLAGPAVLAGGEGATGPNLPAVPHTATGLAQAIHWQAHLDRLTIGHEPMSVYRLETRVLGQPIVIDVSTLGEILRAELPGGIVVACDQLGNPGNARRD